ncbi:hypothetical protein GBAR_LOCUS2285, partial [Geodia barretti]
TTYNNSLCVPVTSLPPVIKFVPNVGSVGGTYMQASGHCSKCWTCSKASDHSMSAVEQRSYPPMWVLSPDQRHCLKRGQLNPLNPDHYLRWCLPLQGLQACEHPAP